MMIVYSVRNNLYAINKDLEIVKLVDLPPNYFFIDEFDVNECKKIEKTNYVSYIGGRKVYKCYDYNRKISKTYEMDVRYLTRLFLDNVLEIADYNENVVAFFDIETERSGKIISLYIEKINGVGKFIYGDEKKIIYDLINWMKNNDIVFLLAWNGFKFDFPIVENAINKYCDENDKIYWSLVEKLDYMFIYDRFVGTERKALDYVAKMNGFEGKVEHEKNIWEMEREELEIYNKRDVDIMIEIEKKYRLIKLAWKIAKYANLPVSEVVDKEYNGRILGSAKTIIDVLLLRKAHDEGYVLPTAERKDDSTYKGAYIWAKAGLYEYVGVFDINSMYPSIILNEGFAYSLIRDIMKEWFDRRFYYKKLWKEGDENAYYEQYTYKILINAMYGVMGYSNFRLYNPEFAGKVTGKGRELIMSMRRYVEDVLGYNVVYIDTDALYINVGSDDEAEFKYIEKKLNAFIKPYSLDWEKTYRRLIVFKKKRYAGLKIDGSYDFKGLEVVRGDVFDLLRDVQKIIIEKILKDGYDEEWINNYLIDVKRRLWRGEFDDKLIYVKGVKDSWDDYKVNTPQVRAWKKLGKADVLFVEYYWAIGGDVEPVREGEKPKNVDYRYYWALITDMILRIKEIFISQKSIFDFSGKV